MYCLSSQSAFHLCEGRSVLVANSRAKKSGSAVIGLSMCPLICCSAYSQVCNSMHYLIKWAHTPLSSEKVHLHLQVMNGKYFILMHNPINFWMQFVCTVAFFKVGLVNYGNPVVLLCLHSDIKSNELLMLKGTSYFIFLLGNVCGLY